MLAFQLVPLFYFFVLVMVAEQGEGEQSYSQQADIVGGGGYGSEDLLNGIQTGQQVRPQTQPQKHKWHTMHRASAQLHEFPYVVSLTYSPHLHTCTGTLLDKETVLTAGHCVQQFAGLNATQLRRRRLRVILSRHKIRLPHGKEQEIYIRNVILHSDFTNHTGHSNIGLVKLAHPLEEEALGEHLAYVSIPTEGFELPEGRVEAGIVGWGSLNAYHEDHSEVLQHGMVMLMLSEDCENILHRYSASAQNIYRSSNGDGERFHCLAQWAYNNGAKCIGDPGSPVLLRVHEGRHGVVQVGVTGAASLIDGKGECGPSVPHLVTRVGHFTEWIRANLLSENDGGI